MRVTCVGGPCDGMVVQLPDDQDVYRPTSSRRPRYAKICESASASSVFKPEGHHAYFALSELSASDAGQLVMEHIRSHSVEGDIAST